KTDRLRQQSLAFLKGWLKDLPSADTWEGNANRDNAIAVNDSAFWAPGYLRVFLPQEARQLFRFPNKELASRIRLLDGLSSYSQKEGNAFRVEHDFELMLPSVYGQRKDAEQRDVKPGILIRLDSLSLMFTGIANRADFPANVLSPLAAADCR